MSQHRRRPAVYGAARTLQEIATMVRDMATSGGQASAVPTHVTQLASGSTTQSCSLMRWDM